MSIDTPRRPASDSSFTRRALLRSASVTAAITALHPLARVLAADKPRVILLRSGWQTVNIGDVAHTPGILRVIETYLPDTQVILWPGSIGDGAEEMLTRNFPKLRIVKGNVDKNGVPTNDALKQAFAEAQLFVHGSGPSVVAQSQMAAWAKTGKPYGIYGVTIGSLDDALKQLLDKASFIFTRETASLAFLKEKGVKAPVIDFAPDATFAMHVRNEAGAEAFMKKRGLEAGKFACVIPRLRYTPYYKIRGKQPNDEDKRRDKVNEEFAEKDHAKLRRVIERWTGGTGLKVLVCPEMTYQIDIMDELLIDKLPAEAKKLVVKRDTFWLPDEAASVYAKAIAVVSCEMHSPIIAVGTGTPAFYVRQRTDTKKGQMWRDVGLKDWIFEVDETDGDTIAAALLAVHKDQPAAREKVREAVKAAAAQHKATMAVVSKALS